KGGYLYVILRKNGEDNTKTVHRLVCETFLTNPYKLPQINHKDENKHNNYVSNLEYCTAKQNTNYGTRIKRIAQKHKKSVIQLTVKGEFVKRWPSVIEAGRMLGIAHSDISRCCKGKAKTTGGYCWKYA
ncbi:HNH endonuclease, partial [Limosilactobacillus vaginalis]|uniref:HNH endonuclease n=1 Tax=Limosilactobacillus vaginalis TaxID=1633 RepID=UPI0025A34BAF